MEGPGGDGGGMSSSPRDDFIQELCDTAGVQYVMSTEDEDEDDNILVDDLEDEMIDDPWQREGALGGLPFPERCKPCS